MRSMHAGPSWRKRKTELLFRLSIRAARQTKGGDRVPASSRVFFHFFHHGWLEISGIWLHLAGGNLVNRSSLVTKFATPQAIFRANRRSKDAAVHGARLVEFAIPRFRIQRGAKLAG